MREPFKCETRYCVPGNKQFKEQAVFLVSWNLTLLSAPPWVVGTNSTIFPAPLKRERPLASDETLHNLYLREHLFSSFMTIYFTVSLTVSSYWEFPKRKTKNISPNLEIKLGVSFTQELHLQPLHQRGSKGKYECMAINYSKTYLPDKKILEIEWNKPTFLHVTAKQAILFAINGRHIYLFQGLRRFSGLRHIKAMKGHVCLPGPREPFTRKTAYLAKGNWRNGRGF